MYADSQITDDSLIYTGHCKIRKVNGNLIGGAGVYTSMKKFFKWVEDGMDMANLPTLDDDFNILIVTKEGDIRYYDSNMEYIEMQEDYAVIGSASQLAVGVLEAGGTPFEAVRVSCRRHTDCQNPKLGGG
jgi:hypothetical protein